MELIQINSNAIEVTWPYVKDFVQKSLDKSLAERDLGDVYNSLIHGQIVLWVATNKEDGILGIMITQLVHHPQYTLLLISLVGTKPHTINKWLDWSWQKGSPLLEYAKENNCKRIEGYIRSGWLKFLKKHGFKKYNTIVTKEVEYND
jgi:hypothetical protein